MHESSNQLCTTTYGWLAQTPSSDPQPAQSATRIPYRILGIVRAESRSIRSQYRLSPGPPHHESIAESIQDRRVNVMEVGARAL
jgi:hypothetical protein